MDDCDGCGIHACPAVVRLWFVVPIVGGDGEVEETELVELREERLVERFGLVVGLSLWFDLFAGELSQELAELEMFRGRVELGFDARDFGLFFGCCGCIVVG